MPAGGRRNWFVCILCCLYFITVSCRRGHQSPVHGDSETVTKKLTQQVSWFQRQRIPLIRRNLVLYHVRQVDNYHWGEEVLINNVQTFVSALEQHTDNATQQAFYLFNVLGGSDNPLQKYIPIHRQNVGMIEWHHATDEMDISMRTIHLLTADHINSYSAVFLLSNDVRGPLTLRNNGQWLTEFRRLLDQNNVGMVGPTVSCEPSPHVTKYMFGWRTELFAQLWNPADKPEQKLGNSEYVQNAGYNLSSLLYDRKFRTPYFDGRCALAIGSQMLPNKHPSSWCHVLPREVIFMYWSGEVIRAPGHLCEQTVTVMRSTLAEIAATSPGTKFIVPETLRVGRLYELYKQYSQEMHFDHHYALTAAGTSAAQSPVVQAKPTEEVCFAVRTAFLHDSSQEAQSGSIFTSVDVEGLIQSLLRQTSPAWVAYFFVTDTNPFEERLQEILAKYEDSRLVYIDIPPAHKRPFTKHDAGYYVTDYVLSLLLKRPTCRWISATNADNIYGSQVVRKVLAAEPDAITGQVADLLLNPIDSRNFMWAENVQRRVILGTKAAYDDFCTGLETNLMYNSYTYTVQPSPVLTMVDLAAIFLSRDKYAAANIRFSNFSDPRIYRCPGCQDGYLAEYLTTSLRWSYSRLPIDGLKSIIFHGPSPTLCIASGKVWYDYPDQNKVGCISHHTARMLEHHVPEMYDWDHFHNRAEGICLRLSKAEFAKL